MATNRALRSTSVPSRSPDRIIVVATPGQAIELWRWATLRSDDVLFVSSRIDEAARQFATRYAVELRHRSPIDSDFTGVSALLLSLDDDDVENTVIRRARRLGVAVHVRGRPLVSDFTVLGMMEQPWPARLAA